MKTTPIAKQPPRPWLMLTASILVILPLQGPVTGQPLPPSSPAASRAAQFSADYQRQHRGRSQVVVPPVQELIHVLMALTATGKSSPNYLNQHSAYYRQVIEHFGPFSADPLIERIERLLRQGDYASLKMNSVAFAFRGNRLVKPGPYQYLAWGTGNSLDSLRPALEQFARRTRFRRFYARHQLYYRQLIDSVNRWMPVHKQWRWCEGEFTTRYDSYRVTFSALSHRSHSANQFTDNGYAEAVLFSSPTRRFEGENSVVTEGLNTRILFTEIDHNYVNPVTERFSSAINEVMAERSQWVQAGLSLGYGTPQLIFNEYMTWGVFSLYCLAQFAPPDAERIIALTQQFMIKSRGFWHFDAFNQELMHLYRRRAAGQKVEDLVGLMVNWCGRPR